MVGVAQLVELRIVIPVVAGSNPVAHPRLKVRPGRGIDGVRGKRFAGTNPVAHPTLRMRTGERGPPPYNKHARVAELVDALVLGTSIVRCESSSLSFRTILNPD